VDRIYMVHDMGEGWALVSTVMNVWVLDELDVY
jgi:hypothetical protein